jgi:hypothetical protein
MRKTTICGQRLTGTMHICAFVDSRDQQYEILLPFLREGVECRDCLLNIVAPERRADHLMRLRGAGIEDGRLAQDEQLMLLTFEDAYLKDGYFSVERMLGVVEDALEGARTGKFGALRGFGEMDWALSGLPGTEELVEYESRVNAIIARFDSPLVCIYDVNKFSGRVLTDILATHPKVILGGRIYENPYYMEPGAFLASLKARNHLREHAREVRQPGTGQIGAVPPGASH